MIHDSKKDQISVVLSGEAGQGIVTVSEIVTKILKRSGYNVFSTKEYMSRVRGGINSTEIRVSSKKVRAMVDKIDILIPLHKKALDHLENRFSEETVFLGDLKIFGDHKCCQDRIIIDFSFEEVAKSSLGKSIYASTVAAGVITSINATPYTEGVYTVKPANAVAVTGGTGNNDATFNLTWTEGCIVYGLENYDSENTTYVGP